MAREEGRLAGSSAYLKALTPEARAALGGALSEITTFPFRVGRESRIMERGEGNQARRRRPDSVPNNDLYLVEIGHLLNVSREHFLIEVENESYVLVDRGSACGTLVEGELVGDQRKGGRRVLHHNDVIIVGTSESKFVFKFLIVSNS